MPPKQSKTAKPAAGGVAAAGGASAAVGGSVSAQPSNAPNSTATQSSKQQAAHAKQSQPKVAVAAATFDVNSTDGGVLEVPRISAMQAKKRKIYQATVQDDDTKAELRAEFQRYLREKDVIQMLKTGLLRIFIEKPRDAVGAMKNHITQWNRDASNILKHYAVSEPSAFQAKLLADETLDAQTILKELLRRTNNDTDLPPGSMQQQHIDGQNGTHRASLQIQQQQALLSQQSSPQPATAAERASTSTIMVNSINNTTPNTTPASAGVNITEAATATPTTMATVAPTSNTQPPAGPGTSLGGVPLATTTNAQQATSTVRPTPATTSALGAQKNGDASLRASGAQYHQLSAASSSSNMMHVVPLVDDDTGLFSAEQIQQQQATLASLLSSMGSGAAVSDSKAGGDVSAADVGKQRGSAEPSASNKSVAVVADKPNNSSNTCNKQNCWLGGEGGMFEREIGTYHTIKAYEVRNRTLSTLAEKLEKLVATRTRDLQQALGDAANAMGGEDANDASSSGSVDDDQRSSVSRFKRGGTAGSGKPGTRAGKDGGSTVTGISAASAAATGGGKKGKTAAADDKRGGEKVGTDAQHANKQSQPQQQQQHQQKESKQPKTSSAAGVVAGTKKK